MRAELCSGWRAFMKGKTMNGPRTVLLVGVFVVAAMVGNTNPQENDIRENAKSFMRGKLKHAQTVLEGLTLEDYDAIAKSSQELTLLSYAAQWQVFQTPEYVRRSAEFRRDADALKRSAEEKNLDGAALNYVKLTMRCVECHKYVRTVRPARFDDSLGPQRKTSAVQSPRQ
jgi:hypothetical protein